MSEILGIDVNNYAVQSLKSSGGGSATLQQKSVTITQNGITNVTPDSGYDGLSDVEITTNVSGAEDLSTELTAQDTALASQTSKISQMIQALENKKALDLQEATSDANAVAGDIATGKTAYVNGVKVTGNLTPSANLQTKSVDIYDNSMNTIVADSGYDGLETVYVNVAVDKDIDDAIVKANEPIRDDIVGKYVAPTTALIKTFQSQQARDTALYTEYFSVGDIGVINESTTENIQYNQDYRAFKFATQFNINNIQGNLSEIFTNYVEARNWTDVIAMSGNLTDPSTPVYFGIEMSNNNLNLGISIFVDYWEDENNPGIYNLHTGYVKNSSNDEIIASIGEDGILSLPTYFKFLQSSDIQNNWIYEIMQGVIYRLTDPRFFDGQQWNNSIM